MGQGRISEERLEGVERRIVCICIYDNDNILFNIIVGSFSSFIFSAKETVFRRRAL